MKFYVPFGETRVMSKTGAAYTPDANGRIEVFDAGIIAEFYTLGLVPVSDPPPSSGWGATVPHFGRIWPDFQLATDVGNVNQIANGWNNTPGSYSVAINGVVSSVVPLAAKGVIMNVSSILNASGVAGTLLSQGLTIYSDTGHTHVADQFLHTDREVSGLTVGSQAAQTWIKVFMPLINGKVYYSVSASGVQNNTANLDYYLSGFWD